MKNNNEINNDTTLTAAEALEVKRQVRKQLKETIKLFRKACELDEQLDFAECSNIMSLEEKQCGMTMVKTLANATAEYMELYFRHLTVIE